MRDRRISKWKNRGIKCESFSFIYDVIYTWWDNCDVCGCKIKHGRTGTYKCLDHNHKTGEIRGIVCVGCNTKIGKDDKFKELLFNRLKFAVKLSKRSTNS